jgi:serine/threonine protein kinase/tetratricopeptide (TPR) repeat protein
MSTNPPLLFGKYKLLELVARGGMAEVFKAKSFGADGFEKVVVIKRILPDLAQNQAFVEMCINEAKLSVALSHANIVQVFDLGREEDTYFIVMEYVNGMDFAEVLRRCRRANLRPPMELCVFIASETARALDYAHRRRDAQMRPLNIVHRDISPQNVLLSLEGEVKVTDFGIAKARTSIEEAGTIKGKYAYMAPEQARGLDVDARADVYALGIVLYEALAGRNPFQEPTPYQTLRRVQAGEKPPLKLAAPDVPDELARVVEKATAPDRDARYASAAKFYEDLAGFLYTTGKRVASHDLAEWLQTLRGSSGRDDDAHRMRDALEDIEPGSVKTPVEIPASASSVSRPGPSTSAGRARPNLERRDVTLVSIDVAPGATPSPAAFEVLMPIAQRYGGMPVERGEDHAVLIFGAQEPDGRDTEMATRCALKLQQVAQRTVAGAELGIGVHAARLHVRPGGEPERDQWFTGAVAQVRDLARAAGNRILASEPVGRLIGEQFSMTPLRGRTAMLERVAGTPLHVLGERPVHEGAHRRFFGRKEPFRRMGEILARAAKRGSHAVALVGEPGTGKTRFLQEVHYRLRRMNHPVSWYTTVCLPHEREVPLAAVQAMLRTILGIDETDPEAVVRERAQRLRELGLSAEEIDAVGVVLGLERTGVYVGAAARPLRAGVLKIATRLAQDQLTVLVWDAAEHMDDESQAIVDELVRSAGRARVVVMVACRPGFIYAWKDASHVEEIALGALSDEEMRQLVVHRLGLAGEAALPRDLMDDLWSKGAGNPLFIEEYLKSLVESGGIEIRDGEAIYRREVAEVGVPKTLRGLVSSEIARLTATQRAILQVASVIGPRFHRDVLVEVSGLAAADVDEALLALVERGSIAAVSAEEFAFAHELRREVVYEGLPLDVRREMHATVAAVIERLFHDRLDELAERLAYHHRESSDRARAVEYLARAARRQQSEGAYASAAVNLARAIEMVLSSPRAEPGRVLALYEQLGTAALRGQQVNVGIDKLRLGLAYAEEVGDTAATVRILVLLGRLLAQGHRINEAVAHFERARALIDPVRDRAELADIVTAIGQAYARHGDFRRSHRYLEEAAQLAGERGDRRNTVYALLTLARCESAVGEGNRALATWERASDAASGIDDPLLRIEVEKWLALIHFDRRDYPSMIECAERAMELAREFGFPYEVAVNAHNMGDAWLRLGDYKRAFTALKTSFDLAQEHGFEKLSHLNGLFLAFIDAVSFGSTEGRAKIEAALAYAEMQNSPWDILQAKYLLGVLAKEQRDSDAARRMLREALALANETDNRVYAEDCEKLLREVATIPPAPPSIAPGRPS